MPAPTYDAFTWANISATAFPGTGAPTSKNDGTPGSATTKFKLAGGTYLLSGVATWGGGNIEVQKLGPDGSTLLSLPTPMKLSANGVTAPASLPAGQYQLTVTTATAVYAELSRVPTA
jgi:hypothetical protein